MRPAAALVLDLDTALRRFETATIAARGDAGRLRRRALSAADDVRAAAVRLALAEAAMVADTSPAGAAASLKELLARLRETGALDWSDIVGICNGVADTVPPGPRRPS